MSPQIPNYIIDSRTRSRLAEINKHLRTLEIAHKKLTAKMKRDRLNKDESALLRRIIKKHAELSTVSKKISPGLDMLIGKLAKSMPNWKP